MTGDLNYDYLCKPCYEDDNVPRLTLTLPGRVHCCAFSARTRHVDAFATRSRHCEGCGRHMGKITPPVDHPRTIRAGDTVNDYKTGEVLADIEYDDELVIQRE